MTPSDSRPISVPLVVAQLGDLLLQGPPVVENGVGPLENLFALRCQTVEALAALDDRHAQLLLELADAPGQGRLRHVAGLGRAREVLLAGERGQVLKLADVHPCGVSLEKRGTAKLRPQSIGQMGANDHPQPRQAARSSCSGLLPTSTVRQTLPARNCARACLCGPPRRSLFAGRDGVCGSSRTSTPRCVSLLPATPSGDGLRRRERWRTGCTTSHRASKCATSKPHWGHTEGRRTWRKFETRLRRGGVPG